MTDKQVLHIRIRDLRRERSLTQEELAEALGVSRQSINAMEAGRCLPSLPIAMNMATFFAVPLQVLFSFEEELQKALQEVQNQGNTWQLSEVIDGLMDTTDEWSNPVETVPAANISEDETDVLVEMCLPGFTKEDLSLEVGDDFITVSGSKRELDQKQFSRREFISQDFSRTLSLPALVETERAEAEMKHGILLVRLPKLKEEKPKTTKLEIKA